VPACFLAPGCSSPASLCWGCPLPPRLANVRLSCLWYPPAQQKPQFFIQQSPWLKLPLVYFLPLNKYIYIYSIKPTFVCVYIFIQCSHNKTFFWRGHADLSFSFPVTKYNKHWYFCIKTEKYKTKDWILCGMHDIKKNGGFKAICTLVCLPYPRVQLKVHLICIAFWY